MNLCGDLKKSDGDYWTLTRVVWNRGSSQGEQPGYILDENTVSLGIDLDDSTRIPKALFKLTNRLTTPEQALWHLTHLSDERSTLVNGREAKETRVGNGDIIEMGPRLSDDQTRVLIESPSFTFMLNAPAREIRRRQPNFYCGTVEQGRPCFMDKQGHTAAPVRAFSHAPNIGVDRKDLDLLPVSVRTRKPKQLQEALITSQQGYMIQIRRSGMATNPSASWVNVFDHRSVLYPTLVSPRPTYNQPIFNSKTNVQIAQRCELICRRNLDVTRPAMVVAACGNRLAFRYTDGSQDEDMWCNNQSSLFHVPGWSKAVGHKIEASKDYMRKTSLSSDSLRVSFEEEENSGWKPGMEFEIINPISCDQICPATTTKILRNGFMYVTIHNSERTEFAVNTRSLRFFQSGFCASQGIPLTTPHKYKPTKYLAPPHLFSHRVLKSRSILKEGHVVEAVDLIETEKIAPAIIGMVRGRLIKIKFLGWTPNCDQFMDIESPNIYPCGYCEWIGYPLQPPGQWACQPGPLRGNTPFRLPTHATQGERQSVQKTKEIVKRKKDTEMAKTSFPPTKKTSESKPSLEPTPTETVPPTHPGIMKHKRKKQEGGLSGNYGSQTQYLNPRRNKNLTNANVTTPADSPLDPSGLLSKRPPGKHLVKSSHQHKKGKRKKQGRCHPQECRNWGVAKKTCVRTDQVGRNKMTFETKLTMVHFCRHDRRGNEPVE